MRKIGTTFSRHMSVNFEGALLVFKNWFPASTLEDFHVSTVHLWVSSWSTNSFYERTRYSKSPTTCGTGYDIEENHDVIFSSGLVRAPVKINVKDPLLQGAYFATHEDRSSWVSFAYEKIFHFCKRCGKIGYHWERCYLTPTRADALIATRLTTAGVSNKFLMYGMNTPLYTASLWSLKKSSRNLNTILKFDNPEYSSPVEGDDSDHDLDGDSPSLTMISHVL